MDRSKRRLSLGLVVHQPWLREHMGKVFTWLVRHWIADGSDATCGFKAFRRDVGRTLFERIRVYDWSFPFGVSVVCIASRPK